jgi:hypothetical protein
VFFNSPGMLETRFALTDSGGTTEYRLTQSFFNNTETAWAGFGFELGFGTRANFDLSQLGDTLVRRTLDRKFLSVYTDDR